MSDLCEAIDRPIDDRQVPTPPPHRPGVNNVRRRMDSCGGSSDYKGVLDVYSGNRGEPSRSVDQGTIAKSRHFMNHSLFSGPSLVAVSPPVFQTAFSRIDLRFDDTATFEERRRDS
jgi:hypothetical protein